MRYVSVVSQYMVYNCVYYYDILAHDTYLASRRPFTTELAVEVIEA
jgi:hypothetical protein